ncbi:hotdog fold domain-containing protein [Marinicella sp. S1101]|uniref:hotdog fold domain-containing protein n=1 Tax=Marinicella marina TaxID=2996016 RepID=UPI00226096EB|nr:hotdog fold domain-containing protein [Marinicella marina]MCX7553818.1 hotdog fold domain-containing protein [Marinicella marina]MDJ1140894.1 hotdog fold domain-containing protein [Marinicella marina]
MNETRNKTHALLKSFEKKPLGLWLFSKAICFKAPYFGSIKPVFKEIRPGFARATIKKKRRVHNHIKTVHAIAMANLCEFVGGTLMEVSIAKDMRWIPKGMDIRYLAKAQTDVTATCEIDDINWQGTQDVILEVEVHDNNKQLVAKATIPMYVSPKPRQ